MQTPTILAVDTPTLGDRSYLVHDGRDGLVVDPQRDIDRVLALADQAGVRIRHVVETHIHNDYVTGGLALAREVGATYHVNGADPVSFDRHPVADGDLVAVTDDLRLRVVATPGHTFTHLSYVLEQTGSPAPPGVFTGGSLLFGSTGRPDLLGPAHTGALVRAQYASAHRLAELPDGTRIYPTHGFGSFCSATQSEATSSTVGQERATNPVLTQAEEEYVRDLLAGLDAYPAYYAHMAPANLAGPTIPDLSAPARADAQAVADRLRAGEWVVDLRARTAFAAGHVPGTLNIGLDGSFATYLGWLIPWGTPVTLLAETPEQVAEAQRELVRIGVDRPAAAATGAPTDWSAPGQLASYRRVTFADLAAMVDQHHHRRITVLDVRRAQEWSESHVEGALHIPLHELADRLDEVPTGEVWVHCAAGYRASIAASMLLAHPVEGRTVVGVDDEFARAEGLGVPLVAERREAA